MIFGWLCSLVTVTIVARGQVVPKGHPTPPPSRSSGPRAPPFPDSPPPSAARDLTRRQQVSGDASPSITSFPSNYTRVDWNVSLGAINGSVAFDQNTGGTWNVENERVVWSGGPETAVQSTFSFNYVGSAFCIEGVFPNTPIAVDFDPPSPASMAQWTITGSTWCLEQDFGYHALRVTGMLAVSNVVVTTGMYVPPGHSNVTTKHETSFLAKDSSGTTQPNHVGLTYTLNDGQEPTVTIIDGVDNLYFWKQSVELTVPANATYAVVWGGLSSSTMVGMDVNSDPPLPVANYNSTPPWKVGKADAERGSVIRLMLPLDSTQRYSVTLSPSTFNGDPLGFFLSKVDFYTIDPTPLPSPSPSPSPTPEPSVSQAVSDADASDSSAIWKGILAGSIAGCVLIPSLIALIVWYCMRRRKQEESPENSVRGSIHLISAPFQITHHLRNDSAAEPLMALIADTEDSPITATTFTASPQTYPPPPILINSGGSVSTDTVDSLPGPSQYSEMTRVGEPVYRPQGRSDFYSLPPAAYESSSIGVNSGVWRNSPDGSREGSTSPTNKFPLPPTRNGGILASSAQETLQVPSNGLVTVPSQTYPEREPSHVQPLAFRSPTEREVTRRVRYADEFPQEMSQPAHSIPRQPVPPIHPEVSPSTRNLTRARVRYSDGTGPSSTSVGRAPRGPRSPTGDPQSQRFSQAFRFPQPLSAAPSSSRGSHISARSPEGRLYIQTQRALQEEESFPEVHQFPVPPSPEERHLPAQQFPTPQPPTNRRQAHLRHAAHNSIQLINANTGSTELIPRVQPLRIRTDSRPRTRRPSYE